MLFNTGFGDLLGLVEADVVEWPKLSQAMRLERERAEHAYSVCDVDGTEKYICYTWEAALRFSTRYGYPQIDRKRILREA
jgi:hypothetical protein